MNDPLLNPRNDVSDLPLPGEIVIYDYSEARVNNNEDIEEESKEFRVKAVQWNIERAYKLDEIIDLLGEGSTGYRDHRSAIKSSLINRRPRANSPVNLEYKNFDVFGIQEFDINCARSDYRNSPLELARALKMKCIFLCEFEEIYSEKLRNRRTQGGGVHGNGILTWWDIEKVEVIDHVEIFQWEADGDKLNEPRRGKRRSLACFLKHPLYPNQRLIVYTVHLEVFCGIFGRLRQFSAILAHSRRHLATHPHQMILGDLNTMAHGLARFLPKYCCDGMRWGSVGWSEAEWWQKNLFSVTPEMARGSVDEEGINYFLSSHYHPIKQQQKQKQRRIFFKPLNNSSCEIEQEIEQELDQDEDGCPLEKIIPPKQAIPIFTPQELSDLINPYFFCPFPVSRSKTVEMHGYSGKLDWMLMRNWRVEAWGLDNEAYCRSDHKLLWTQVVSFSDDVDVDVAKEAHDYHFTTTLKSQSNDPIKLYPPSTFSYYNFKLFMSAGLLGITSGVLIYYLSNLRKQ